MLVLEEDGTAVETEAFFRTLEEGAVLMALAKGQTWAAPKVSPMGSRIRNPPNYPSCIPKTGSVGVPRVPLGSAGIRRDAAPRGCLG